MQQVPSARGPAGERLRACATTYSPSRAVQCRLFNAPATRSSRSSLASEQRATTATNRRENGQPDTLSHVSDAFQDPQTDGTGKPCYLVLGNKKGKEEYLYSAFYILCISQSAQAWITQFYLQIHHASLSFVCVHQMAPPLTQVRDI